MTGDGTPRFRSSTCPGCGLTAPEAAGPPPAEHAATAACWEAYGQLLSRSYSDPRYRAVHQLVVDAYAAQHAGGTSRREVQGVALCLMTLCLVIEHDVDPAEGPALHKRMVAHRPEFTRLAPPRQHDLMTVADVLAAQDADEHRRLVTEWARQVWQAWSAHHATIRIWNDHALGRPDESRQEGARVPPTPSRERADEVESLLRHLTGWARRRADVRALALVGSWAYGAPRQNSDVDVVLLTDSPRQYIDHDGWLRDVGGVRLVRTLAWGHMTERRFALASGLEVELGVETPAWASVDPLDEGTRRVVADGMQALHDPDGLLTRLAAAVHRQG